MFAGTDDTHSERDDSKPGHSTELAIPPVMGDDESTQHREHHVGGKHCQTKNEHSHQSSR